MSDLSLLIPEASVVIMAVAYLVVGLVLRRWKWLLGVLTLLGFGYIIYLISTSMSLTGTAFGVVSVNPASRLIDIVILVAAMLTLLVSMDIKNLVYEAGFFLITGVLGAMLLDKSTNLIMLVVGLEVLSFSLYAMVALPKRKRDAEASIKYFVLGAFSSAFLLMGIAMVYGMSGSFDLAGIVRAFANPGTNVGLAVLGLSLMVVGLFFKVSAVPFHFWTPDVFEGALAPVASFIATASKAAAFGVVLMVFNIGLGANPGLWQGLLWWVIVLTMFAGNTAALLENSVKRMLAYSTIAHAGYVLISVLIGDISSLILYMLVYTLMTAGAFAVVSVVGDQTTHLKFYKGLSKRRPLLAFLMTLFMLSLAGVPPLAGFIAKFYIFTGAMKAGYTALAIIGLVNGVISAFYYLRVVVYMYMMEAEDTEPLPSLSTRAWTSLSMAVSSMLVVYLGVFPGVLFDFVKGLL